MTWTKHQAEAIILVAAASCWLDSSNIKIKTRKKNKPQHKRRKLTAERIVGQVSIREEEQVTPLYKIVVKTNTQRCAMMPWLC